MTNQVFVGITKYVGIGVFQFEVNLVQVGQYFRDEAVTRARCASQLGAGKIKVLKQFVEIILALGSHRTLLNTVEDGLQVFQDEITLIFGVGITFSADGRKQLIWSQKVTQFD